MTEPDRCPECHIPIETMGSKRLLPLHRDSSGKRCEGSGRSLVHYRWIDLFKAITGTAPRV